MKSTIEHRVLLPEMLKQIKPVVFYAQAFPEAKILLDKLRELPPDSNERGEIQKQLSKLKLQLKHYLILSIENVLQ